MVDGIATLEGFSDAEQDVTDLIQDRKSFSPDYFEEIHKELYVLLDYNLRGQRTIEWKLGYVDGMRNKMVKLRKMVKQVG